MSSSYIGIKMGSNETCIYKQGEGIVLREASLIAMPTNMKTVTTADASFEIQRGMEVGRDFEKYFHKKLSIL